MSQSQKALQAVLVEGITLAEAAERYGISTAAISKAKHHPSKKQLHAAELDQLRAQLAEAQAENERLNKLLRIEKIASDNCSHKDEADKLRTALAAAEAREDNLMSSMEVAASALIQLKDSFAERGARPITEEKLKLWNLAFSAYENLFEVFNQSRNESLLAKKNLRSN